MNQPAAPVAAPVGPLDAAPTGPLDANTLFRPLEEADLGAMYDLTQLCGLYPGLSREAWIELRRWSLFHPYVRDPARVPGHLLFEDGALIAYLPYAYPPFLVDGALRRVGVIGTLMTHPERRGPLAIRFSRMCRDAQGELPILGMHFSELAGLIWRRLGGKAAAGTELTFRGLLSLPNGLRLKWPALGPLAGLPERVGLGRLWGPLSRLAGRPELPRRVLGDRILFPLDWQARGEELAGLCSQYQQLYDFGLRRDLDFLTWRYADHPLAAFPAFGVEGPDKRLVGVGFLQFADGGAARLAELIYDPEVPRIADRMIAAALEAGRRGGGVHLLSKRINASLPAYFEAWGLEKSAAGHHACLAIGLGDPGPNGCFTFGDFKDL